MVSIENIDFLFPRWLTSSLHAINDRWETFQAMIMRQVSEASELVSEATEFCRNHPVIGLFLAVVAVFGFFPILAFLAIVCGSFVVIFVTAFTVFQGVVVVSLMPLLAVLVPIVMIGGTAAIFVYIAYRSVANILHTIKRIINAALPSQVVAKPMRFRGYKVKPHTSQQFHYPHDAFTTDEEPFEEELFHSSPNRF